MNKAEFIDAVASAMGVSKTKAAEAVTAVLSTVQNTLAGGNELRLVDFGVFKVVKVGAKHVRNPQNGQQIYVPERWKPKFTAGKKFKDIVNTSNKAKK